MQDKNGRTDFEQSFINASWDSLRKRLDDELPAPSPSNQGLIILLSTLLLFSIGTIIWLGISKLNTVPAATITRNLIQYEKVYIPVYAKPAPSLNANTGVAYSIFGDRNENPGNPPLESRLDKRSMAEFETRIFKNFIEPSVLADCDPDPIQISELPTLDQRLKYPKSHSIHEFNLLPVFQDFKLQAGQRKIDFLFSFRGLISNLDYTGYGIGIGLEWPLGPRFSINAGVGLNFVSRNYFVLPFFERQTEQNLKSQANTDLKNANTFYEGLNGFKQVVLPLGISYNTASNLSLNTGVRFRYTYAETIDRVLKTRARQTISKNQSVANTFFNNSNLGIYTGVSYQLTDHISLSLDAEWGVHSLISNKHLSDPDYRKYDMNLINFTSYFRF